MKLFEAHPGTVLTMAYAIAKRSPGSEAFERPTHEIRRSAPGVVYDAHRKSDRRAVVQTPKPKTVAKASHSTRLNTSQVAMDYLEAGAIIAAAETRGPGYQDWARFAYDPDHGAEWSAAGARVGRRLFCAWAIGNRRAVRIGSEKFQDLATICAYNSIKRLSGVDDPIKPNEACVMLGYKSATDANWWRTIKPHFDFMELILDIHNARTLYPVRVRIHELKHGKDRGENRPIESMTV